MTRLAIGDVVAAHEAADRLATVARASGLERLEACAALAGGRVAAAEGEERAVGQLKRAVELFASLELPLDARAGAARTGTHACGVCTSGGGARGQARAR